MEYSILRESDVINRYLYLFGSKWLEVLGNSSPALLCSKTYWYMGFALGCFFIIEYVNICHCTFDVIAPFAES